MSRIDVGILGATGMVGQQFIALLANHPWFNVAWVGASQRSEGKAYRDATSWRLNVPLPDRVASLEVDAAVPARAPKLVFSGLDSSVAGEIEPDLGDGRAAIHRAPREPSMVQRGVGRRQSAIRRQGVSRRDVVASQRAAARPRGIARG